MTQENKDILLSLVKLILKTIVIGLMSISMIGWSILRHNFPSLYIISNIISFVIFILLILLFADDEFSFLLALLGAFLYPLYPLFKLLDFIDEY